MRYTLCLFKYRLKLHAYHGANNILRSVNQRNSSVNLEFIFMVSSDSSETFLLSRHILFDKARSVAQNKAVDTCSYVDDVTM